MPSGHLGQVLRQLRRLVGGRPLADLADAELLEQFVARQDMAAFESLVQRYGPVVLGVCRRVLGDEHDAEDAFQATFLVFARRAGVIRSQGAVGSWLCGTAYRISLKAKTAALRRRVQEREASTRWRNDAEVVAAWDELQPVLDEELQRLPEKYRAPLILCYLEGKSNEAAARELGWKPGSMSYRLAQARERLRERLMHRGLSSAFVGPTLAAYGTLEVSAALADATAKGSLLFAAGQSAVGFVSVHAVSLAEGVLRAMEFLKAVFAAFFLLMLAVVGGTGVFLFSDDKPVAEKPPEVKPLDKEDRIAVSFTPETSRFGVACLKLRDPRFPEKPKLLTSHTNGANNNTCIQIEGFEIIFGREVPGFRYVRGQDGKPQKNLKVSDRKWISVMLSLNQKIQITQSVEIVVGEQTQLYDTALVKYVIENQDNRQHTVGLRAMLDTLIGANDGVPFLVPPSEAAPSGQLVDTLAVFEKAKVPDFLRALESSDLHDKNNTVAELGLKLKGLEPVQKVVICRWPGEQGASEARWDWKFEAMNARPTELDSCVVLYWPNLSFGPGEKRTLGYTYGLGRIADGTEKTPMRLLAGGAVKAGREFTLTFYIKGLKADDKVKLKLPEGLQMIEGQQIEQVIKAQADKGYAQVSWRVRADKPGKYEVFASHGGRDARQEVHVRANSIFD